MPSQILVCLEAPLGFAERTVEEGATWSSRVFYASQRLPAILQLPSKAMENETYYRYYPSSFGLAYQPCCGDGKLRWLLRLCAVESLAFDKMKTD